MYCEGQCTEFEGDASCQRTNAEGGGSFQCAGISEFLLPQYQLIMTAPLNSSSTKSIFARLNIFGHISLNYYCPIFKFKKSHIQQKEPVVSNIMVVVRTACLSSQVTT